MVKMMKKLIIKGFATFALCLSVSAHAATFDFANIAEGLASSATLDSYTGSVGSGPFSGELGATNLNFSSGSIGLTASANFGGGSIAAYLDSYSGGKPGGLGACQNLTGGLQCNPNSDDNVTTNESLKLEFDQVVTINSTTFRNGNHGTSFTGVFDLTIDGFTTFGITLAHLYNVPLTGTSFTFSNPNVGGGSGVSNDKQFYIETMEVAAVPVPAAVWLLSSGLLGIIGVARRKA